MKSKTQTVDEYREQIIRCARSLAVAQNGRVSPYLPDARDLERVKMFTEGNLDKRLWKLQDQLEFLSETFENIDEQFARYIREVPLAAYDTGAGDCQHFLEWLCRTNNLTPEQLDYVTCEKCRIAVEELAAENRIGHLRFQDLLPMAAQLAAELETNPRLWIHLNPVHVPATFFTSALIDEQDDLPANVVFFPVGNDVRTAVLEDSGDELVRELNSKRPSRLDGLLPVGNFCERADVIEVLRELSDVGLVAFG